MLTKEARRSRWVVLDIDAFHCVLHILTGCREDIGHPWPRRRNGDWSASGRSDRCGGRTSHSPAVYRLIEWAWKQFIVPGLPAWSKGGIEDEAIWDLTSFLKIMPSLSLEEYHRQVEASDGHSHGGLEERGAETESESGAEHPHDTTPHSHIH